MMTPFTVIKNEEKLAFLDFSTIGSALNFSKEDIDLYFFQLSVIASKHPEMSKKNEAWKYLLKQHKLQNVLNDLIARVNTLEMEYSTKGQIEDIAMFAAQKEQLEQEIQIFQELHFRTKRAYLRFVHEHFQHGWGQSFMVA